MDGCAHAVRGPAALRRPSCEPLPPDAERVVADAVFFCLGLLAAGVAVGRALAWHARRRR